MTKKVFIIALTLALGMLFCVSAFAAKAPSKSKQASMLSFRDAMSKERLIDRSQAGGPMDAVSVKNDVRTLPSGLMPLGKANPAVGQGPGTPMDETYWDLLWSGDGHGQHHIEAATFDDGGTPRADVHFHTYQTDITPPDTIANLRTYLQTYRSETGTGWNFNGQLGGLPIQINDTVPGFYPTIAVGNDGRAVLACHDGYGEIDWDTYPDSSFTDHVFYYQPTVASAPNFTRNHILRSQKVSAGVGIVADSGVYSRYPRIAIADSGTTQIIHCVARDWLAVEAPFDPEIGLRHLVYWRNIGASSASGAWSDGEVLCTVILANYGICAQQNGGNVAVVYAHPHDDALTREVEGFFVGDTLWGGIVDKDLWYVESNDYGDTWGSPSNFTNFRRDTISYTANGGNPGVDDYDAQFDAMYDNTGNLHVVFVGQVVWADPYDTRPAFDWCFLEAWSSRVLHWDRNSGNLVEIANGVYGYGDPAPDNDDWNRGEDWMRCWGAYSKFCGWPSLTECDGKLYVTWQQYNSTWHEIPADVTWEDSLLNYLYDCGVEIDAGDEWFFQAANAEIFLRISTGLAGQLWDAPRNLTQTYTSICNPPDEGELCGNECFPELADDVIDADTAGASYVWPSEPALVPDPPGGGTAVHTNGKYLQMLYLDDVYAGCAISGISGGLHPIYNTELRWARIACVEPETAPVVTMSPKSYVWPQYYVENGGPQNFTVTVKNSGNTNANITVVESETWMDISPSASFVVPALPPTNEVTFDMVITPPAGSGFLTTFVEVNTDDPTNPTDTIVVNLWASQDPIAEPGVYDTAATNTDWEGKGVMDNNDFVALAVSNHGEQGNSDDAGGVNLDFTVAGGECDPLADVYLFSSSPFVVTKANAGSPILSSSHYQTNVDEERCWAPMTTSGLIDGGTGSQNGKDYDSVFTGRMNNADSTVWLERTYYAPRNNPTLPNFVAVKTVVGAYTAIDSIAIGEATDWDVPTVEDTVNEINSPNVSATKGTSDGGFTYFRGVDSASGTPCTENAKRYATNAYYAGYYEATPGTGDPCEASAIFHNSLGVNVRDYFDDDTTLTPQVVNAGDWWNVISNNFGPTGNPNEVDQGQILTYQVIESMPATGQYVYWTIYVTGYGYADTEGTEFEAEVDEAKQWLTDMLCTTSCCIGLRGNVDKSVDEIPGLGDLTVMIDHLFVSFADLPCWEEANVDGSSPEGSTSISLGDLTVLIDILFVSFNDPIPCP